MNRRYPLDKKSVISNEGSFGAVRKYDIHTGIDLYSEEGSVVYSIEPGIVKKVALFTGPNAGSPWWEETHYVGVAGSSGYIVYGEIDPQLTEGQKVEMGAVIGKVKRVLKKNKNKPMTMLHLELYDHFVDDPVVWNLGKSKPDHLLNPISLIEELRFNHDCISREEMRLYMANRQKQLLHEECFIKEVQDHPQGLIVIWEKSGQELVSFFIEPQFRAQGIYSQVVRSYNIPVMTVDDCLIVDYLKSKNITHLVLGKFLNCLEYQMIQSFYENERSERSNLFLMNHIDEGLFVLKKIGASENAMKAFCLHPIFQADIDLSINYGTVDYSKVDPKVIVLAMEYRSVANEYLSKRFVSSLEDIRLSPLKEVNDMLVADKVQNYKDFLLHHAENHPQAKELDEYFKNWLKKLNVSIDFFDELKATISIGQTRVE